MNSEIVHQYQRQFEALREVCLAADNCPQRAEVKRICLHAVEAVENYMTDRPPANYGGNLKYGKRSKSGAPELPTEELIRYVDEMWRPTKVYLEQLDLSKQTDAWGMAPIKRVLYVMRHTQHHLGQASRLVGDAVDLNRLCLP